MKTINIRKNKSLSNVIVVFLILALPVFVWALVNLNFNYKKKAASGEPSVCIPDSNKTIVVTDVWGNDGGTCHDIQTAINAVNGDGYTITINRGDYNITDTIYITDKTNLKIEGNVEGNLDEVWLSFNTTNGGGYGIKVTNSSGSIERLHAEGITPNGLLSIQNSTIFNINRTYLFGTSSHTFDVQNSSDVSIANSEVKSSAGAIEIENSQNINILDNRINNSATGISAHNSSSVSIINNLITANNSGAIRLWNVGPYTEIWHNTIAYNVGSSPTIDISGVNPAPNEFSQNIVAFNTGAGLVREANSTNFDTISFNDVFSNYAGYNYAGMSDPTGVNGNISADPRLSTDTGYYCLLAGSPAVYGAVNNHEYMGHAGPCNTSGNQNNCSNPIFIQILNSEKNGQVGQTLRYELEIENTNNSQLCGSYLSHLIIDKPSNWSAEFAQPNLTIMGGQKISTYVDVTSPVDNYLLGRQKLPIRLSTENYGVLGYAEIGYHLSTLMSDADLAITDITLERTSPPQTMCESYVYKITVKNIGTERAPKTTLQTFLDPTQKQTVDGCDNIQTYYGSKSPSPDSQSKTYLDPGESYTYSDYFNPTETQEITIRAAADMGTVLTEHNEMNNYMSKKFNVVKLYPAPTLKTGDVNNDNKVNMIDIGIVVDEYDSTNPLHPRADVNNNGRVDLIDIGIIVDNYEW